MSIKLSDAESMTLRFVVGARVECCLGKTWAPGTVVQHFYREETFLDGTCVPYQVALDDGRLAFARRDADRDVRLLNDADADVSMLPQKGLNRTVALQTFRTCCMYVSVAFLAMQLMVHYRTGRVSWSMKFAPAELVDGGRLSIDGAGVAACAAAFAVALIRVVWRDASTVVWLSRAGIRAKTGGADVPAVIMQSVFGAIGQEIFFRGALPAIFLLIYPDNANAVVSGLTFSIVAYFAMHRKEQAFSAGLASFWFAIAAFYGGVYAAVLASVAVQLSATYFYFHGLQTVNLQLEPAPAETKKKKQK